jgi:acylphosphatase
MSDETIPLGYRWLLTGRVQGVGFRHFALSQAQRLGVGGWVRNLPDGRVEIRVVGSPVDVAALKDRMQEGPPAGRVDELKEEVIEPNPGWTRFEVRF